MPKFYLLLLLVCFSVTAFAQSSLLDYGKPNVSGTSIYQAPMSPISFLDQIPNQVNGLFADASCTLCPALQQSVAENFVVATSIPDLSISEIVIWGGYYPENIPNSVDEFTIIIHSDAGGSPGYVVEIRSGLEATIRTTTGTVLYGCDEYIFTFDFSSDPIYMTNAGTYWLELYNNSIESGNFFWETGDLDVTYGLPGSGWTTTTPGVTWNIDPSTSLSALICGEQLIPVELVSFEASASGGKVNLNWTTATEKNNRGFSIERSSGSEFETIGFVNGSGTTTEHKSYSFQDDNVLTGNYTYRLKQIDFNGTFQNSYGVEVNVSAATGFTLAQNFPNPFNPTTTIKYGLQTKSNVKITVLNSIGQEVALLINETKEAGYHQVQFNGVSATGGLPSGVYFYRIQAGNFTETKKMILMK